MARPKRHWNGRSRIFSHHSNEIGAVELGVAREAHGAGVAALSTKCVRCAMKTQRVTLISVGQLRTATALYSTETDPCRGKTELAVTLLLVGGWRSSFGECTTWFPAGPGCSGCNIAPPENLFIDVGFSGHCQNDSGIGVPEFLVTIATRSGRSS